MCHKIAAHLVLVYHANDSLSGGGSRRGRSGPPHPRRRARRRFGRPETGGPETNGSGLAGLSETGLAGLKHDAAWTAARDFGVGSG